ncbi:MAG: imidazole glycerol phosphate synthase subunit HisH [Candidatus Omnitrophica bacterium]|nr:imidazole glycerol phosphate synthase subunit HisH [Candidatus Omnitrophota bacterium]
MDRSPHPSRVLIVDYGSGNLFSIERALHSLGAEVEISADPDALRRAPGVILPGVGAFGDGMKNLREKGLLTPLAEYAQSGLPLLGICLGMQLLFTESQEFGRHEGLGLIPGKVVNLRPTDPQGRRVKIPHVGWSQLMCPPSRPHWNDTILMGLPVGEAMYFVHSFIPVPEDSAVVAQMIYGGHLYCAVVERRNMIGCQFHPEKSGPVGLRFLRNFLTRIKPPKEEFTAVNPAAVIRRRE